MDESAAVDEVVGEIFPKADAVDDELLALENLFGNHVEGLEDGFF